MDYLYGESFKSLQVIFYSNELKPMASWKEGNQSKKTDGMIGEMLCRWNVSVKYKRFIVNMLKHSNTLVWSFNNVQIFNSQMKRSLICYSSSCPPDSCEQRSSWRQFHWDPVRRHHSPPSGPQNPTQQMQQRSHLSGQRKDGGREGRINGRMDRQMNE